jgi:hypothetical protein
MRRTKMFYLMSFSALFTGALVLMHNGYEPSALVPGTKGTEIAVIPTEQEPYAPRDIQIMLELPAAFFHQRGENWVSPLTQINFALNIRTKSATILSPLEDVDVVVVTISNVAYDAVDAGYNRSNPRYSPHLIDMWDRPLNRKFELNYVTNQTHPGAVPAEYFFDDGPFYRTSIYCKPSGNTTPTLCYLRQVGERGGGVNPKSKFAVMTEIMFRRERIPDWKEIAQCVHTFLQDKITVRNWKN